MFQKRFGIITVAVLLLWVSKPTWAIEWSGYLENSAKVNSEEQFTGINKFKLDLKEKKNQYLMMVSLNVLDKYGIDEDIQYEFNRAYLDIYPAWGVVTVGKQRIAWGDSYFFNLVDLFNQVNLYDPKGELSGIDGLSTKWNLSATSGVEGVLLPVENATESDYGIKFKHTLGLFDFTASSLKKTEVDGTVLERKAQAIEVKGEFSDTTPGLWFQYAFNSDTTATGDEVYRSFVLGCDYTFKIGSGFYLLGEYLRDGASKNDQWYITTEYDLRHYLTLKTSGYYTDATKASFYSLALEYGLNDTILFTGTYYVYPDGSSKLGELVNSDQNIKKQIVLKLKTTF